jgi:hypothetical protein
MGQAEREEKLDRQRESGEMGQAEREDKWDR